MKKLLDHIFFLRPLLIIPIWTIVVLGARAAALGVCAPPFRVADFAVSSADYLLVLLITGLLYGSIYAYNQINDIESDRKNGKLLFLAENIISMKAAYGLAIIPGVIAVAAGFFVNYSVGILLITGAALGFIYSHPYFNYKGRAGKALWSNMFGCGSLPFLIGWAAVTGGINMEAMAKSLPYLMAVGAVYLNTVLPDRDGDRETGKKTYGVIWTVAHCQGSALARLVVAVVFSLMAGDYAALIAGGAALPFFIWAAFVGKVEVSVIATQVAVLALAVMAGIYFLPYLAIVLIIIVASRFYYKWRFNLAYPRLK